MKKNFGFVYLIVIVLTLAIAREPKFLIYPRIWAEEGSVYLQQIIDYGIAESFFLPNLGYYSLLNKIIISGGYYFGGLTGFAFITTYASLGLILAVVMAPVILPSEYWDTRRKKAILIILSVVVGSGEIWLNTINLQFYLAVFAAYLLLSDTAKISGWRFWYSIIVIFFGSFTGVTTVVLTPFFIFKYFYGRNKTFIDRCVIYILLFGLLLQCMALFYSSLSQQTSRFTLDNINNLSGGFVNTAFAIFSVMPKGLKLSCISLLVILALLKNKMLPIYLGVWVSFFYTILSIGMQGGARYGYFPSIMILVFLVGLAFDKNIWVKSASLLILAAVVVYSSVSFFNTKDFYDPHWVIYDPMLRFVDDEGRTYIKIFPQWNDTNWVIYVK